ncbi:MAG: ribonuclease E activity regulator RraA [Myxococcota bacterium]
MSDFLTADLWDEHEQALQVVCPKLRSYGGRVRFSGTIATVKCFEDNSRIKEAVNEAGAGRVLVVDAGGSLRCALLGDQMASAAVANGWAGVVIFGCIRDAAELAKMDLGVLALSTIPRKSIRRGEGQRDLRVHFHDVAFEPGAELYADEDGVVVMAHSES